MRNFFKHLTCMFLSACLVLVPYTPPVSSEDADDSLRVVKVDIAGNSAISDTTILSKIKTKPGTEFSQDVVNDDIRRLYAIGFFSDVEFNVAKVAGGVAIEILIQEKPVVDSIEIIGNKKIRNGRILKAMKTKPDQILDYSQLTIDLEAVRNIYEGKGFANVTIEYDVEIDRASNKAAVLIQIDEQKSVKIARINYSGNYHFRDKMLKKLLKTKKDTFLTSGVYKKDVFESDIENIRRFYKNKGYLDVDVTYSFDYVKAGRKMIININIEEGKPYFAGEVRIAGYEVLTEEEIRKVLTMVTDEPFSEFNLRQDAIAIRDLYHEKGYMSVRIDFSTIVNQETEKIDVAYTIVENELTYVNQVHVRGNVKTKDIVLRREMRLDPGDQFDGAKLKLSKKRLYRMGIFDSIDFTFEDTPYPDRKDVIINVKEGKTGEFSFGAGYSSVNEFIGFVQVTQKNFDILNWPTFVGDAQRLTLRAELGTVRQDYEVSFTEPWIFGYPVLFGFDLYQRSGERSESSGVSYDIVRQGGNLRLGKELSEEFRGDFIYRLEDVEISDVEPGASPDLQAEEGTNTISSLLFQLTHDTRDNNFNPKTGHVITASVEGAGGVFEGDKDFVRYILSSEFFHPLIRDDIILALTLKGGAVNNYDDTANVPIYERFFTGGGGTIRGYKERRVGPRDRDVIPVGGEQMVLGSVEITFPLYTGIIKGATFFDIGNVWQGSKDEKIRFENLKLGSETRFLKAGAGVGVRIKTPIGPVKLDYGYPLTDNHEDPERGHFYFSMSRGF